MGDTITTIDSSIPGLEPRELTVKHHNGGVNLVIRSEMRGTLGITVHPADLLDALSKLEDARNGNDALPNRAEKSVPTIPQEAVIALTRSIYPWATRLSPESIKVVHDGMAAALSAAYPAIRAHIIRELAEEARAENLESRKARRDNPCNPYADIQAQYAHRWLSSRAKLNGESA